MLEIAQYLGEQLCSYVSTDPMGCFLLVLGFLCLIGEEVDQVSDSGVGTASPHKPDWYPLKSDSEGTHVPRSWNQGPGSKGIPVPMPWNQGPGSFENTDLESYPAGKSSNNSEK